MKKNKEDLYAEVTKPLRSLLAQIKEQRASSISSSNPLVPISSSVPATLLPLSIKVPVDKPSIIVPIEKMLGVDPGYYSSYFELEGFDFPDLWKRNEEKIDDIDSKAKVISTPHAGRMLSDLYIANLRNGSNAKRKVN